MGQKPSSVEDLTSLSKKELKVKSKKLSEDKVDKISLKSRKSDPQMTTAIRKIFQSDSSRSIAVVVSEKQQQKQQQTLECAISASPAPSPEHSGERLINNAESKSEKKNTQADNDTDSSQGRSRRTSWPIDVAAATAAYSTEPLSFSLNPRIAELGHLTAWQMMQNFESLTKVDSYLRSQKSSFNATMEDNISEKSTRSIGSGDLPQEQSDVTANDSERHSATCTAIEIDLEPTDDGNKLNVITGVEVLVSKEEQKEVTASMPKAVVAKLSPTTTSNDGKYDEASKLRSEVIQLREGIDRVRYERDEARLRLRVAEERCEAYETESIYLEATLGSMEEKIRDLAKELSAEVTRSRTLEQQLSLVLSNTKSLEPKLQQTDKIA